MLNLTMATVEGFLRTGDTRMACITPQGILCPLNDMHGFWYSPQPFLQSISFLITSRLYQITQANINKTAMRKKIHAND